jgi:hypothetical protein
MGKKSKKKNRKKKNNWTPPKGSSAYFSAASDDEFKKKHPIGYFFLVLLGITALLLPVLIYLIFVLPYDINSPWIMLGWVGGFVIGIGLFNFVAIVIKQYLGHIVSILSFIIGGILIWISLVQMGIV